MCMYSSQTRSLGKRVFITGPHKLVDPRTSTRYLMEVIESNSKWTNPAKYKLAARLYSKGSSSTSRKEALQLLSEVQEACNTGTCDAEFAVNEALKNVRHFVMNLFESDDDLWDDDESVDVLCGIDQPDLSEDELSSSLSD